MERRRSLSGVQRLLRLLQQEQQQPRHSSRQNAATVGGGLELECSESRNPLGIPDRIDSRLDSDPAKGAPPSIFVLETTLGLCQSHTPRAATIESQPPREGRRALHHLVALTITCTMLICCTHTRYLPVVHFVPGMPFMMQLLKRRAAGANPNARLLREAGRCVGAEQRSKHLRFI